MKRIFNYDIAYAEDGLSINEFLKSKKYSAPVIAHLKRTENGIMKNGKWDWVRDILHTGDVLQITLVETESSENIVPRQLPFPIIYEDDDLLIINKPANMPIHPSQGNYENTLANAAAYYFTEKGEAFTYRCINRLDRDTTGLLILAKHMYSASLLSNMVKDRAIHREYLAVVTGTLNGTGTINAPIGRVEGSTIERGIDFENGDYACTHYQALEQKNGHTLVSIHLETGRTHQIRVHMKHIGHPLPGDFLYNPDYSNIKRQALHSHRLSFKHPVTGVDMDFTAPLPEDMAHIIY